MRPEGRIDWSAGRGRPGFPGRRGWLRGQCRAGHVPLSASRSRERPSPKARSWLKSPKPRARHHRRGDRLCVPALQCTAAPRGPFCWRATPASVQRPALQSRTQARVPQCPFQPGACHAGGAASPGCALGGRSPWRMSWSRWRRRWSSGYVDPQLGGGAGPGGMLWPKEGEGRAPPPLRPAPPSRPQPGTSCLVGLPRGPLRWCSLRLLTAPFSVVAPVRPLWRTRHSCGRRAGQGRKMSALLAEAAFLGPLKGTWPRVKQIQGVWPALWGSWISPPNRSLKGSGSGGKS